MRTSTLLLLAAVVAPGCRKAPDPTPAAAPEPGTFAAPDVGRLRWLEGDWRGTGDGQEPFYEGYRFLNDSTIRKVDYTDATRAGIADSSRIALAAGRITSGSGDMRWAVAALDADSVHFVPLAGARNAFTWRRTSDSTWTATLRWPAGAGRAASERVYRMVRLRR